MAVSIQVFEVIAMRLISLQMENFRVFRKVNLTFPDSVIGIIGPNGAGKSSIVEAISWALYGTQVTRSGKDEIKSVFAGPFESCQVTLEFAVNGQNYRVIRRLAGKIERPEVELYRGETSESVGVNETRQYVGELFGLDWRGFLTSFLARQQELNALSDLQPARRRDQLAGMMGIERLDRAFRDVKRDCRIDKDQTAFLERQLADSGAVQLRLGELSSLIPQLSQRVNMSKSLQTQARKEFQKESESFLKIQQTQSQWLQLTARIEAQESSITDLAKQLSENQQDRIELISKKEEMASLQIRLAELPATRKRMEAMEVARNRVELRRTLMEQKADLTGQIIHLETSLSQCKKTLADYQLQLSTIPDDTESSLSAHQERLEQTRHNYSTLRSRKLSLEHERGKITDQLQSITQLGPESVCDLCQRPLGDSLPHMKDHLAQELHRLDSAISSLIDKLTASEEEGKQSGRTCQKLEEAVRKKQELTIRHQTCQTELSDLKQRQKQLITRLANVEEQLTPFKTVSYDQQEYDRISELLKQLEIAREQQIRLSGEVSRLPTVENTIKQQEQRLASAREHVMSLKDSMIQLAFKPEEFEIAHQRFETERQHLESARDDLFAAEKEMEVAGKELQEKTEQMKRFEKVTAELEETRSSHYHREKLADLLAEFRKHLIGQIRPTLASLSSRLMAEMTDWKYTMLELDEKYNLRVMDAGKYYGVERFSGGEKDLANLCLRLAISLALTESAGLNRSFIILDEVFGSQDNDRKDLIIRALTNLKNRFPQILLITHIEDIKDRVEQLIEINPGRAGHSEVRINGELIS
ncbi:MAG: SMC family ATPase [bacterium]